MSTPSHSGKPAPLLRLTTCGSVDDGKSTLIGRLLYDAGLVPNDHLAALVKDSRGRPCGPEGLDFSLLVDGLAAEREQGITIDVAYRYFATSKRSFVVADAPGHEQYTRNMVTAASNADAAIVLADARKGILSQTRRHIAILALMGVSKVALVVNKMDLVDYEQAVFHRTAEEFEALAVSVGITSVTSIPVSALTGANVARRHSDLDWGKEQTLLEWLEAVTIDEDAAARPFRMPVQWVNRAGADFRGLSGLVASGRIRPGDRVAGSRSGRHTSVARIVTMDGDLGEATAGQAVTLVLADDVDIGRGDVLFDPGAPPAVADQFAAHIVWFADEPLLPRRSYLMQLGTELLPAEVTELKYRKNIETLDTSAAKVLETNEIGACNLALARPVAFEHYKESRDLGSFILIDCGTRATVGGGVIDFPLRRASNLRWQDFDVTPALRAAQKGQRPAIVWFTGLSGSGKSTITNHVERLLHRQGRHAFVLDGDNVRHRLNRDLGFTDADRVENVRRVAEVARLMAEAGLIVLVSLISPFRLDRRMAREIAGEIDFFEVFVDASLETCERRDPKGLYAKARSGQITNFTGVNSRYERPEKPDLRLETDIYDAETCIARVLALLKDKTGL